jgi:hypothetical protein
MLPNKVRANDLDESDNQNKRHIDTPRVILPPASPL